MPIVITRGNNVYGPNQYPEKLIPRFIQLLHNDKPVTIQGDGSALRGFLHSSDTAAAFLTILQKGQIGEIYNIGCEEDMEYSVDEVARMLIRKMKNIAFRRLHKKCWQFAAASSFATNGVKANES